MIIKLNRPSVYQAEGVKLVPGDNDVDPGDVKKFFANKIVKADIKAGVIEVEKAKKAKDPTPPVTPTPPAPQTNQS